MPPRTITERVAVLEAEVAELKKDVSAQGKSPRPAPVRRFGLEPGTAQQIALILASLATMLGSIGGAYVASQPPVAQEATVADPPHP